MIVHSYYYTEKGGYYWHLVALFVIAPGRSRVASLSPLRIRKKCV